MKIGIITDSIRDKGVGISYYSKSFIRLLFSLDGKNKFYFIDYEENNFNKDRILLVKNYFQKFPVKTYTWHNTLPFQLRKLYFEFVFNLSGIPHLLSFRQKEIFWVYDLSAVLFPQFHTWWRVLINKILLKRNLQKAHKIVAISESTKKDLIKYFRIPEEKIIIIYPQITTFKNKEIKPKMVPEDPYLLYLGTLEPRKNISFLIKAFKKTKDDLKIPHKLIIAGKKGWGYSNIFALVEKLKLGNNVIFTGYVTEEEKKYLYKYADLFVYPSFYEGFGIPPLEAMSYSCPVITSSTSSLPEVVGDAAIKIDPNSISEISEATKKVLNDEKLKRKLIKEGLIRAKKFTGLQAREAIKKAYNKIIET